MKRLQTHFFIALLLLGSSSALLAQTTVTGQVNADRIPVSAVPFLTITPDARSAGLGDAGVALSATDANGTYWNISKMVYAEKDAGVSLSYTPWLRNLIGDMWLGYVTGYKKIGKNQVIGLSLNYFNLGEIQFTNENGIGIGQFDSKEFAASGSYALKLSNKLALGLNLRYINSNLTGNQVINGAALKPGQTVAGDISIFSNGYSPEKKWYANYGAMIQNLGGKINYGGSQTPYFIPTNLKIGTAITNRLDDKNSLTFTVDLNKLMVPTPPETDSQGNITKGKDANSKSLFEGVFGSFADAPGGFSEELKEISVSAGMEYSWNKILAARLGYFYESPQKGNRNYITAGFGVHYQQYGLDFAYLFQGSGQQNPLNNTLRLTLSILLDKKLRIEEAPDDRQQ
ncbi:MAG: type IX secretion system outer membrane channel protein PorV [Siphonobacter sp.]